MTILTDKEILDVALKYCDFTPEGTYHMRKFSGWAIVQVVRECLELQELVNQSASKEISEKA